MTAGWEYSRSPYPMPPRNTSANSPFIKGAIDIRWDSPSFIHENEGWIIRGVNIYRSNTSDRGPYQRINQSPISATFYRDTNITEMIYDEVITNWISRGGNADGSYRFKTARPIARIGSAIEPSTSYRDVIVKIDGNVAYPASVFGQAGEIVLRQGATTNVITLMNDVQLEFDPNTSVVTCTYLSYLPEGKISSIIDKKTYYRVTTVAEDPLTSALHETPLDYTQPFGDIEIEKVDWMWKEAVRRNQWALEQGGERVRLFLKKVVGQPCECGAFNRYTLEYGKQPDSRCIRCFGTGLIGGYDGPYDIIVAPDDAERRISQATQGRRKEHSYEVYIGPSPIVGQRDFIVKQNNDRYSIGPVRRPNARGNVLQQHFNLAYFEPADIRYSVPMDGVPVLWHKTKYTYQTIRDTYSARNDAPYSTQPDSAIPMMTEKAEVSANYEIRGRSAVWENHNHGG